MSDKYLLCSINEAPQMVDGEADLISETEKRALGGRKTHAYRLVPVELAVSVKARLIKRRSKNSPDAAVASGRPPVPDSGLASGEVVPEGPSERAQSADDRGARPGEAVLQTASDCRESTEENRAPSSGDASDGVVPPKPDTGHSVCAVCDDPVLPGKPFCGPHNIGGVKPEVVEKLRKSKGQLRAAAPLVPHD